MQRNRLEKSGVSRMRVVVQRVNQASVTVGGDVAGRIGHGLLVLLGVAGDDRAEDGSQLARKLVDLRVFEDGDGKMNLSLAEVGGEMLVVSQFTLLSDCRKGRRPSFVNAAAPELARTLYEDFVSHVRARGISVATGVFQAHMEVALVNDGPVTLLLDSRKLF
jgi:D-tyrosyl-tRNA(Tyr) deacylase